jgi:hypothetical protein
MYYYLTRLFAALAVICVLSASADARTWKSSNNKYDFQGEFVELDGDDVVIESDDDGERISVDISKLSKPDQAFVRKAVNKAKAGERKADKGADYEETESDNAPPTPKKGTAKVTAASIKKDLDAEITKIEDGKGKDDKKQKDIANAKIKAGEKILKISNESAERVTGYELQVEGLISLHDSGDKGAEKKLRTLAEKGKADKKVSIPDKMRLVTALQAKHGADGIREGSGSEDADAEEAAEDDESSDKDEEPAAKKADSKVKANLKKKLSRQEPEEK